MINQRLWINAIVMLLLASKFVACTQVPITGRRQFNLIPESDLMAMSLTQYNAFLSENKLSTNAEQVAMVQRVGNNMARAVESYFKERGWSDQLENFSWQFNLVENPAINAWCMPGGKIVFYSGIMPICKDDMGVAVVMGHEIAHAIARHGSERMSQQLGVQAGAVALSVLLAEQPVQTQNIFMTAFGVTTQLGMILPYSRSHEYEADRLGMIIMALAGYNPEGAIDFWNRMAALDGPNPPAWLSTHPTDQARIQNMMKVLPEAMRYYQNRGR